MSRRHRSNGSSEDPADRATGPEDEFDAYLAGAYVNWLMRAHQSVPAWAWVNCLAHAGIVELDAMTRGIVPGAEPGVDASLWHHVVTFLAKEVLDRAEDGPALRELQRQVLVPVELRLADHWWDALAPIDVATIVLVALQNVPHRR